MIVPSIDGFFRVSCSNNGKHLGFKLNKKGESGNIYLEDYVFLRTGQKRPIGMKVSVFSNTALILNTKTGKTHSDISILSGLKVGDKVYAEIELAFSMRKVKIYDYKNKKWIIDDLEDDEIPGSWKYVIDRLNLLYLEFIERGKDLTDSKIYHHAISKDDDSSERQYSSPRTRRPQTEKSNNGDISTDDTPPMSTKSTSESFEDEEDIKDIEDCPL